jgi:hypothetical protein
MLKAIDSNKYYPYSESLKEYTKRILTSGMLYLKSEEFLEECVKELEEFYILYSSNTENVDKEILLKSVCTVWITSLKLNDFIKSRLHKIKIEMVLGSSEASNLFYETLKTYKGIVDAETRKKGKSVSRKPIFIFID